MAETPEKPSRHIEVFAGAVLLIVTVGFVFFMVAKSVLPGLVPLAQEGAQLAKPSDLVFYALAGLTMVSAGGVAFSRNIIYSALSLLGTLLGAGAIYVYLGADYVAVTQLLVYIGGVLVLILFAVMLTSKIGETRQSNPSANFFPSLVLLVALLAVLGYVVTQSPWLTVADAPIPTETAFTIGDVFLKEYLLPFEVSSLVLLATLIGAVVIARKEIKEG